MKLWMVWFICIEEYNFFFFGDLIWVILLMCGLGVDG